MKAPEIDLIDQPSLWNFVKKGANVSAKVYYYAKPIPEAVWHHNGMELSLSTRIVTEMTDSYCLLTIRGM